MKIEAMIRAQSDEHQTAFRTNPPLSDDVFEAALKFYLGGDRSIYSMSDDGLFIVQRADAIASQQVKEFEEALAQAYKHATGVKARGEQQIESMLQERANRAGLPLQ